MSCWKGVRALWLSLVSLLFCNEGDCAERLRAEIRYGSQDWIKKKKKLFTRIFEFDYGTIKFVYQPFYKCKCTIYFYIWYICRE